MARRSKDVASQPDPILTTRGNPATTPTGRNDSDRSRALGLALAQIEKQHGKGAVMRMGEMAVESVGHISTGSLSLDIALGVGGLPRGRVIEVFGPEGSGKTTQTLHVIAEAQRAGGTAAFIDAEHALDPVYAKGIGVDIDELLISQPSCGEEALDIAETLVRSGAVDVIVVDSVAALVPKAEIEGEMGDAHVGLQARLMSQALRKLTGAVAKSKCVLIFINQLREKVGVMFGNPEVTPGGRALKFYSSVRLDVRKVEALKEGNDIVGNRVKVKVVKNKVAPPFREAQYDLIFGKGISYAGDVLDLAVKEGIVQKSGAWYSFEDARLAQGRAPSRDYLVANPDILKQIADKVMATLMPSGPAPVHREEGEPEEFRDDTDE